jgi:hypothetical protein
MTIDLLEKQIQAARKENAPELTVDRLNHRVNAERAAYAELLTANDRGAEAAQLLSAIVQSDPETTGRAGNCFGFSRAGKRSPRRIRNSRFRSGNSWATSTPGAGNSTTPRKPTRKRWNSRRARATSARSWPP